MDAREDLPEVQRSDSLDQAYCLLRYAYEVVRRALPQEDHTYTPVLLRLAQMRGSLLVTPGQVVAWLSHGQEHLQAIKEMDINALLQMPMGGDLIHVLVVVGADGPKAVRFLQRHCAGISAFRRKKNGELKFSYRKGSK